MPARSSRMAAECRKHMHGHRFLRQRRTGVAGHLDVFGEPVLESVAAERFPVRVGNSGVLRLTGALGQPDAQDGDLPDVSGVIRCFRPFPMQLTCAPAPRWTSAQRRPISSEARSPVWTARPNSAWSRRPVQVDRSGAASNASISGSVRKVTSRRSKRFGGMARTRSISGGMLGMAKGRISEQRADRGKPGVAGAHAVLPLVLQVVEEGADQRGIEIVDVQLRRSPCRCLSDAKTSSSRSVSR